MADLDRTQHAELVRATCSNCGATGHLGSNCERRIK